MTAIVRLALMRYITPGIEDSVGAAVRRVCSDHIDALVPKVARQDADPFRRWACYNEPVDLVLRHHEESLRALFDVYAAGAGQVGTMFQLTTHMDMAEWMTMVDNLSLIDDGFNIDAARRCAMGFDDDSGRPGGSGPLNMHMHLHMHMHMPTRMHMHTCTCTHAYAYMHMHACTCTHAHMHTCTCTHAHMHTCTHAHMHTCTCTA